MVYKNNCNIHLDINELTAWPYYAEDWLLEELGAEFRYIDGVKETLIDDIVYAPHKVYPVGLKALKEIYELDDKKFLDINNVSYDGIDETTDRLLGEALKTIHRIEDYITNSFIFAVGNKKYADYTINELTKLWKSKFTFGNLIKLMKEQFVINEDVENSLELFLYQRNKIAHGLTKDERFDIDTLWGKKELTGFFAIFMANTYTLERVIQSAYIATIAFGYHIMENDPNIDIKKIKKEIKAFYSDPIIQEQLEIFTLSFQIKHSN